MSRRSEVRRLASRIAIALELMPTMCWPWSRVGHAQEATKDPTTEIDEPRRCIRTQLTLSRTATSLDGRLCPGRIQIGPELLAVRLRPNRSIDGLTITER